MENDREDLSGLMVRYQSGDRLALEELYRRTRARVFYYLLSGAADRSGAEDLLQETFLQLHRARRSYLPGRPVMPWILGIARHVLLMSRRSEARRHRLVVEMTDEDLPEVPVPADLDRVTDLALVRRTLHLLPPDQREALVLHYVLGLSYGEIGKSLGVLAGTVKLRAFRGLQQARRLLGLGVTGEDQQANR